MYRGSGILFFRTGSSGISLLLIQRNCKPHKGYWSIPGGKMDKRDNGDYYRCAIRETNEELFGKKAIMNYKESKELVYSKSKLRLPWFTFVTYILDANNLALDFEPNWEISAVRWYNIKSLPRKTFIGVYYTIFVLFLKGHLR